MSTEPDPTVYQRPNDPDEKWYSEDLPLSQFLIQMFDWQAGLPDGE